MEANKVQLVRLLSDLNNIDVQGHHEEIFKNNADQILNELKCSYEYVAEKLSFPLDDWIDSNHQQKYILLNFYILEILNDTGEILSVQETKKVKETLKSLVTIGILKNINKNLPHYFKHKTITDPFLAYELLKITCLGFCKCIKCPNLRMLVLPHFLQAILVGLYQLSYCPLKKPTTGESEDQYKKWKEEQDNFKESLENLKQTIHPTIFIKEAMLLSQSEAPIWFKKAINNTLTSIIKSPKGVEHIAVAMLDGTEDDQTKTWKILDVLTRLIINSKVTSQVIDLLNLAKTSPDLLIFERLFISCVKTLYQNDKIVCESVFIKHMLSTVLKFTNKEHTFEDEQDVTDDVKQIARVIHGSFIDNTANLPCLPVDILKKAINVLFYFFNLTMKSKFETTYKELKEIVTKYVDVCSGEEIDELFDNFLFNFPVTGIEQLRNDIVIEVGTKIIIKQSRCIVVYKTPEMLNLVLDILKTDKRILLFGYLLRCIAEKEKYFKTFTNNSDLLHLESDFVTNSALERMLAVHKLLSELSSDKDIQKSLKTKPDDIINCMKNILLRSIETGNHETSFVVIMLLDNLIANAPRNTLEKYRILKNVIDQISRETSDEELKSCCNKMFNDRRISENELKSEKSDLDKALEDVCDSLLPVRGHGLLTLTKLIEKKDKNALERKQYIFNIFQMSLKDEDSFIYLNAIQGVAAMANLFPDTVLEVLCEEYVDLSKSDFETRMKLGEILVKTTKSLGEMAQKYKSLLLNTFLVGTKDDNHLLRASSLSNLGELCAALGYKLGTIISEILVCVHSIIATDKAPEARRAAVTVIRQLFIGLSSEMLAFLKEDILPIYRTLKEIYHHDKDDIMKLQAQLALEELNENMKTIIFPKVSLNSEKKPVILE